MVAIFTGAGAGFERGSGSVLGSAGLLGSSNLGRGGDQLFLNAANGNLMISNQDEFLAGLGLDVAITRTYNSLGDLSDDNGDNWRFASERKIFNSSGTYGAAGSTVQRMSSDGSVITYTCGANGIYSGTDSVGVRHSVLFERKQLLDLERRRQLIHRDHPDPAVETGCIWLRLPPATSYGN